VENRRTATNIPRVSITISGEVERITFENEKTGYRVLKLGRISGDIKSSDRLAVVGVVPNVGVGTRVRVTGQLIQDARHGEQLRVESLVVLEPETILGIERHLSSGILPGIGPGLAHKIVSTFGTETLSVLDHAPEKLAGVPGLGMRKVGEIRKAWAAHRNEATVMVLLQSHGMSPSLARRVLRHYGENAARIVQSSPYRLAMDVWGVGFKTADRIAQAFGVAPDHPERIMAGLLHQLRSICDEGHCWVAREALIEATRGALGIDESLIAASIDQLWGSARIAVSDGLVAPAALDAAERTFAKKVTVCSERTRVIEGAHEETIAHFERELGIELAPEQRAAVLAVTAHSVVVITGGPGVGKTTIVRAILRVLEKAKLNLALAAPTGRAAKRLSETTGRTASTLHRLLEFDPKGGTFKRNEDDLLLADAVLVDEFSMVDLQLASSLVSALRDDARLIIVGDADQLPSVGPGAVLRDMVDARTVPVIRLQTVFRQDQASYIVQNAHRIQAGLPPQSTAIELPQADFFMLERREPERAAEDIITLVTERIPQRFALDPTRDVQVLTPMHRGPVGTQALNQRLQEALNPGGPTLMSRGQSFRVGDKVMQTHNDYDKEVFNGDIGRIESLDEQARLVTVNFDDRRVMFESDELDSLVLAYATSIHKSQGSEYAAVVIPLLTSHFVMLSRNLLYTAVTRAKRLCVLVTDPKALRIALSEDRREERQTRLIERLRAFANGTAVT
jgi:exodeoxyribonuclease V alpha subunit